MEVISTIWVTFSIFDIFLSIVVFVHVTVHVSTFVYFYVNSKVNERKFQNLFNLVLIKLSLLLESAT